MTKAEVVASLQRVSDVSRETVDRLEVIEALLGRWNPRINLVARDSLPMFWERHILDSAQLWQYRKREVRRWVDIGSGAGFPGLVIAAIAAENAPDLRVCLVESDVRKAAFLSTVLRETGVQADIITDRIEALETLQAGVLSARALAPLVRLLEMAEKHLLPDGIGLFPKGRTVHKEITDAEVVWRFNVTAHVSLTDPASRVLEVGDIHRA